jgi:prepilin-type N-terminal cleavage/methylation domain-containing protein
MRANRGFTLLELMIVLVIVSIVGGLVVWQGRSARRNASMAAGAYELALRIGGLKARAMADGREYLLVVTDTDDPGGCKERQNRCGRVLVLRNPDATFAIAGFSPDPPIVGAEYVDDGGADYLPQNSRFDLTSTWAAPGPFSAVTAFGSTVLATCAGGRRCFAIRFRPDGEVRPELVPGTPAVPPGFAFVLRPHESASAAAEKRAVFVSFPTGIVKTAAFAF